MLGAYLGDFTILGKYPWRFCLGSILLMIVISSAFGLNIFNLPGDTLVGVQVLSSATFSRHHVQSLALLLPVVFVPIIYVAKNKGYQGIILCQWIYALLCFATLTTPEFSGFVHFATIGMGLLLIAVLRNWFGTNRVIGTLLATVPCIIIFALLLLVSYAQGSWISMRLIALLNPQADPLGFGFVAIEIRQLLSEAALLGEGTMPEFFTQRMIMMHSDFLLSIVIFRFGWLPFAVIMGALLLFIVNIIARCLKQRSDLGFFVSLAVALTFSVQILMYVIFNLGFIFTYISLPLISPGNLTMVINMGLVGLMLSVFRTGDAVIDKNVVSAIKNNRFVTWNDGKLTINFK